MRGPDPTVPPRSQPYEQQTLAGTATLLQQSLAALVRQLGEVASLMASSQAASINTVIPWVSVSASQNAVSGVWYAVSTTAGAVTLTLPASPAVNQYLYVMDADGSFSTHNCTLNRNGSTINGSAANLTLSTNGQFIGLVYAGATPSWRTFSS